MTQDGRESFHESRQAHAGRYAELIVATRVIIVGSEAPAVDRLVGHVRKTFPKIAASGRR